jgi:hypothetical protein
MYGTSASGDPTLTPSRAMPSGSFPVRPMPTPTAGYPTGGVTNPSYHGMPSDPTMAQPGTHPMVSPSTAETMRAPSGSMQIPIPTTGTAGTAGTPGTEGTTGTGGTAGTKGTPGTPGTKGTGKGLLYGGIAAGIVLLAVVGIFAIKGRGGAAPAVDPVPTPVVSIEPTPTPADALATATPTPTPTSSPTASTSPSPVAGAPSTTAAPKPTTTPAARGAGTATPTASPAVAAAAAAATAASKPAADDPLATFSDVKFFRVNGKRAVDTDVVLNFSHGQLAVMPRSGGAPVATLPYDKIAYATFIRARAPRWSTKYPAPPDDLDLGGLGIGVLRTARPWLVLQGADSYAVLRLDDNSAQRLLETFEQRTGLKIDRPK